MALSGLLIVFGIGPLAYLLIYSSSHNFQPLAMKLPLARGQITSPEFKTDLDQIYMVQIELMGADRSVMAFNQDAVLDLDWKIVDADGRILAQGSQNEPLRGANNVNLDEYHPPRRLPQKMIVDIHRDIAEPDGTTVTLEVNSTDDPEGRAIGFVLSLWWAGIAAGLGAIILLIAVKMVKRTDRDTPSRTR
jgi:type IV secretory pathway TrbD component